MVEMVKNSWDLLEGWIFESYALIIKRIEPAEASSLASRL